MTGDPEVTWTMGANPPAYNDAYQDAAPKTILRVYTYFRRTGDMAFLRWAFPAMQASLRWIQAHIPNGTYLPVDNVEGGAFSDTYDSISQPGNGIYISELYLLSLDIMIDTAKRLSIPVSQISGYQTAFDNAKQSFQQLLWNPVQHYYMIDDGGGPYADGVLLDSFFAQHIADEFGLPDLVNMHDYHKQLLKTYGKFVFRRDSSGHLLGASNVLEAGLPVSTTQQSAAYNGVCDKVQACPTVPAYEADGVWPGTNYEVGATYVTAGHRFNDSELVLDGEQMATAVAYQIWQNQLNGFAFDSPGYWEANETTNSTFVGYKWALAIWDTIEAIKPLLIPNPTG